MDEVLRFFRTYELWIYIIIGLGGLTYFRKFLFAWRDLRGAIFGLEREEAQNRLNQATGLLVILIIIAVAEFILVSYVAPLRPGANPLMTSTLDVLATATTTLSPNESSLPSSPTNAAATAPFNTSGCVSNQIEISSLENGSDVNGEILISGYAIAENFGFYKLEVISQNESEAQWRTIQAGRDPVQNGTLVEKWDTSTLSPGEYILRLVVTLTTGDALPDCQVFIRITN